MCPKRRMVPTDTLMALPSDHIKQFHQHINSIEASIQFTVEEESDGSGHPVHGHKNHLTCMMIVLCPPQSSVSRPTLTGISTLLHTTHLPPNLRWSEICLSTQKKSAPLPQTRMQRGSMSPEASAAKATHCDCPYIPPNPPSLPPPTHTLT